MDVDNPEEMVPASVTELSVGEEGSIENVDCTTPRMMDCTTPRMMCIDEHRPARCRHLLCRHAPISSAAPCVSDLVLFLLSLVVVLPDHSRR